MDIRPANPADVPAVLPMVERICALHESWDQAKYSFLPDIAERYRGWLTTRSTDARSVFLVCEKPPTNHDAPLIVGFLVATIEQEIPIYRLKEYGFIHDVWIEPLYRHEGLGRQMTMLAIERFRELGIHQIRLDTAHQNESARALFATCGFRPGTIEMIL